MITKVKIARFAESINLGGNNTEVMSINTERPEFKHLLMLCTDRMLYIFDKKKEICISTSSANLRMMLIDENSAQFFNRMMKKRDKQNKELDQIEDSASVETENKQDISGANKQIKNRNQKN
jgi:hypothetical protein